MKIFLTLHLENSNLLHVNDDLKRVYYNPLTGEYTATPHWFTENEIQIGAEKFRIKLEKVIR